MCASLTRMPSRCTRPGRPTRQRPRSKRRLPPIPAMRTSERRWQASPTTDDHQSRIKCSRRVRAMSRRAVQITVIVSTLIAGANAPAYAQADATQKPNIVFIMGDDIGWMQPSIYHRGLMVGETPNIDRIGREGGIFMDYVAMQSCTSGRTAFFAGMYPLRTGMIPPQLPGSPSYLRPGTPAVAQFLHDLGYTTGEFGKNHLGDHTAALPTAHGFEEYWGYLYHLDAMQQ